MTPNFKLSITLLTVVIGLSSCTNTLKILDGSTHACGNVHVEGYITDSQGEVRIVKAPDTWTPEQVRDFCGD